MSDQFILQTIWREKGNLRFLVEAEGQSWRLSAQTMAAGEFPIEAALTYAERIFGPESVITLWKLGQVKTESNTTHIFCLDTETIENFSNTTVLPGMTWINEQQFYQQVPKQWGPLLEKIRQPGLSK